MNGPGSAWLPALHQAWRRVRGRRLEPARVPFSIPWEDLLDAAGLHTAEDRQVAAKEARRLADEGKLQLATVRYRPQHIDRVRVPLDQEVWLHGLFHYRPMPLLQALSLEILREMGAWVHPLHGELWWKLCAALTENARAGSSGFGGRALDWRRPEGLRNTLSGLFRLTARQWPPGTKIREASLKLGLENSKTLEKQQRRLESALAVMFGRPVMRLEALGITTANSRLLFDGPLTLVFADGSVDESRNLRHGDAVTAADLERAVQVRTTAVRLVSVENSKTTFQSLAEQNGSRGTLLFGTSFPTRAVELLLEKLEPVLPWWHFGDTDPAGYLILQKLRRLVSRPVRPLAMDWLDSPASPDLSPWDQNVLTKLNGDPLLLDCQDHLDHMRLAGRKGAFEQEGRPLPDLEALKV